MKNSKNLVVALTIIAITGKYSATVEYAIYDVDGTNIDSGTLEDVFISGLLKWRIENGK